MFVEPYKGEKPFIFISYAHRDMERVMPILERMAQMKCRMWYDEGIDPGTEWAERIAAHVEACDCMLAFLSPNYIASENCKDELDYARDLLKERILVYLEPTKLPRGMAMRLNRIQAIYQHQYSNQDRFYERLMEAPMIIRNRRINAAAVYQQSQYGMGLLPGVRRREAASDPRPWPVVYG